MARINTRRVVVPRVTFEGGRAEPQLSPYRQLRRLVCTCLLWEDTFYKSGSEVVDQICTLVPQCDPQDVANLAAEARKKMNLRSVPLLLVRELARTKGNGKLVEWALEQIIQRADELAEFLALYWKDGKCPISASVKRGLAGSFTKFNAYQLAKYNRDNTIKLRDVMFMVHPKPMNDEQAKLWKQLAENTLPVPDTWEVALSGGADKYETFTRLLSEKKLGGIATLRNLRNMLAVNVDKSLIESRLMDGIRGALPFQFVTAARYAPQVESALERAMLTGLEGQAKLPGRTGLLIDVSGSMDSPLAERGEATRIDAAAGLAIMLREIADDVQIATFSKKTVHVPDRRGFGLRDAINNSQSHGATYLKASLETLRESWSHLDRIIVITDEQSQDGISNCYTQSGYVVNVAAYDRGVGADRGWTKVNGWSEHVVEWIRLMEELTNG